MDKQELLQGLKDWITAAEDADTWYNKDLVEGAADLIDKVIDYMTD